MAEENQQDSTARISEENSPVLLSQSTEPLTRDATDFTWKEKLTACGLFYCPFEGSDRPSQKEGCIICTKEVPKRALLQCGTCKNSLCTLCLLEIYANRAVQRNQFLCCFCRQEYNNQAIQQLLLFYAGHKHKLPIQLTTRRQPQSPSIPEDYAMIEVVSTDDPTLTSTTFAEYSPRPYCLHSSMLFDPPLPGLDPTQTISPEHSSRTSSEHEQIGQSEHSTQETDVATNQQQSQEIQDENDDRFVDDDPAETRKRGELEEMKGEEDKEKNGGGAEVGGSDIPSINVGLDEQIQRRSGAEMESKGVDVTNEKGDKQKRKRKSKVMTTVIATTVATSLIVLTVFLPMYFAGVLDFRTSIQEKQVA